MKGGEEEIYRDRDWAKDSYLGIVMKIIGEMKPNAT